ncbi:aminotransferase class V-fold PLP-dependent enzyme [soil metagenome]
MAIDFQELRDREFSRLDAEAHVYLDYTGSGLYSESQIRRHAEVLTHNVYGNPHSRNPTSLAATRMVDEVRERLLGFFDADAADYEVVFTPNATGALKLVGESYPFQPGSRFVLTADNHNSVNGIREFAAAHDAEVLYIPLQKGLQIPSVQEHLGGVDHGCPNLFVFPAQSNFSGVKHPMEWVASAQGLGYDVFLDAAAFAPTSSLKLREFKPDYVALSFYKMFGFPTGVGALLARRSALKKLRRPWFCGGTVRFVSAQPGVQLPHVTGRAFEDGTLNFLDIAAIPLGLDFLEEIGMERVNARVMWLTETILQHFRELTHSNGAPMICVYGPSTCENRGATVAFNVLDPQGELVDFRSVEERANQENLSLRTGYFCNPGAAEFAFEHPDDEIRRCASTFTAESFSIQQFSVCLNRRPVGGVRISFGVASTIGDMDRLLQVLTSFRDVVQSPASGAAQVASG